MKGSKLLETLKTKTRQKPMVPVSQCQGIQRNSFKIVCVVRAVPMVCDLCRAWKTWTRINSEIEIG